MIKQISPIAWQHINLHGRYEFSKQTEGININEIVGQLAKIQVPATNIIT
jgi:hypothetical protein